MLKADLERDYHPTRYERGEGLRCELTGVCPADAVTAEFTVEKFVGGGFAGQVYRARLDSLGAEVPGLVTGQTFKLKLLKPPSRMARRFRNALYWLGYQGAFSAQVNLAAARSGALWQTLIRRGARIRFGRGDAISETYATFWDQGLRCFGEVGEWVEGRQWRFELDSHYFKRYRTETPQEGQEPQIIGPPEFLAKRDFMRRLVELLHDMGAPELARQYEWWTMKSQPNVLKRTDAGTGPGHGLSAIDFRAGLALLPFLPMSPVDLLLILKGIGRGSWVQFDRGDLAKLEAFIQEHPAEFADLQDAVEELRQVEPAYRRSLPDVTHQGFRLLCDSRLRQNVVDGTVNAWTANEHVDDAHAQRLRQGRLRFMLFWCMGAIPLLGKHLRRLCGHDRFRLHVRKCLTSFRYLWQTLAVLRTEVLIEWHRDGRVSDARALVFARAPVRFWTHRILFGLLPAKWHRFLTDGPYAWECLRFAVTYPLRLLFDPAFRERWLSEQVHEGHAQGMLSDAEASEILDRLKDPYIQRYLKCCAVHVCTLPVTQVVSVLVALYVAIRFGKTWDESLAYAGAVLVAFQVVPISPGSIVRGVYAVYVMLSERDFRRYRIAVLISFWKYIGYLGFPIQMVAEYPALARFMAGRWATQAVHIIPVFGERGALLEHTAFDLFFNVPLTLRSAWQSRKANRQERHSESG